MAGIVRDRWPPGADALTILFIVFTCTYVAVATSLSDLGENQRMRFFLDLPIIASVTASVVYLVRQRHAH
jgi:hypothetical protein